MAKHRLIWVPQYPVKLRYQEWWYTEFPKQLSTRFDVITLGGNCVANQVIESEFANVDNSILFETQQIAEYLSIDLQETDSILLADVSFPGIFSQVLFHKRPKRIYGICHATSLNYLDYFSQFAGKTQVENAIMNLCTKVYVATEYHKQKLYEGMAIKTEIEVVGLPDMPINFKVPYNAKTIFLLSVARNHPQKIDTELEKKIEKTFACTITRKQYESWGEYYQTIRKTNILLITSKEETYGYQVIDALNCGTIVLAPRNYSYPELLDDDYLYSSFEELAEKIVRHTEYGTKPKNKMQEKVNKFFEVVC